MREAREVTKEERLKAQRAYLKKYRQANPEKFKKYREGYWSKKFLAEVEAVKAKDIKGEKIVIYY
ncbi:hypothetical protein [Clostridium sp. C2-6-12]|uniref:hypothetical protein n=1 Tax=Clostridium sp. C2-6-12 TaxID=2698832 RepID=UPI0013709513|nr:hypothetical protein [Clostridium sp. C2-6-12]